MSTLSVLIPARCEEWLVRTVDDVLANSGADTDVIVVLDGTWPDPGLPLHPRVSVIFQPMPIGQRAATNLAARISTAEYVMKLDAHCSMAPGFDAALLEAAQALGRDVLQVPAQKNLKVWEWVCQCGWRGPQSPPPTCPKCGGTNASREVIWQPRRGTTTTAWVFDETLHFQYSRAMQAQQTGDYPETMSLLGACWFADRRWFLDDLDGLDEAHGSWGQMGTELACKAWLSGGRVVCNTKTHFAHFFRVNGIGFPYQIKHSDQEAARGYSRSLWMANAWPRQIRPLSWLVEKFAGPAGWSAEARSLVESVPFSLQGQVPLVPGGRLALEIPVVATPTVAVQAPTRPVADTSRETMPVGAAGFPRVQRETAAVSAQDVGAVGDQNEVGGVAAPGAAAVDVIEYWDSAAPANREWADQPRVHQSVREDRRASKLEQPVAISVAGGNPNPATTLAVDCDLREKPSQGCRVDRNPTGEMLRTSHVSVSADAGSGPGARSQRTSGPSILTAGALYYSDNRGDPKVLAAARRQVRFAAADIPIVAVTLPGDLVLGRFDGALHLELQADRGYLTMARQILTGLQLLDTDIVFHCEHDVLYPPGYFDFRPPAGDTYHYAANTWKVDAASGRALTYQMEQLSGLCADRLLLLDHFRRRVAHLEQHGFSRRVGFEPGKPIRHGGLDDVPRATWQNPVPIVDIRHGANLTPSRWSKDQFRNQKYTAGWTEGDAVPGWGTTAGRFNAWLQEVTEHGDPR